MGIRVWRLDWSLVWWCNLQFIDLLVLEVMVQPVSWGFPRKSVSIVRQRAQEQALRNTIISSPIQQKVLHEKQKELPVVGINTVRSGRKVPVAGCSTFSVSSRGHTSTDKSPLIWQSWCQSKAMGADYFPLKFFLDLSIWGCNLEFLFSKFRWVDMWEELGMKPVCKCSLFQ